MSKLNKMMIALGAVAAAACGLLGIYFWKVNSGPDLSTPQKQYAYIMSKEFRDASLQDKKEILGKIYSDRLTKAVKKYSELLGMDRQEYLDSFIDVLMKESKTAKAGMQDFMAEFFDEEKIRARAEMLDDSTRALYENFILDLKERIKEREQTKEEK